MGALAGFVAAILNAILNAFVKGFADYRADRDRVTAHENSAVTSAELETTDVIKDAADARAGIDRGGDADAIARRLQQRATERASDSGKLES